MASEYDIERRMAQIHDFTQIKTVLRIFAREGRGLKFDTELSLKLLRYLNKFLRSSKKIHFVLPQSLPPGYAPPGEGPPGYTPPGSAPTENPGFVPQNPGFSTHNSGFAGAPPPLPSQGPVGGAFPPAAGPPKPPRTNGAGINKCGKFIECLKKSSYQ